MPPIGPRGTDPELQPVGDRCEECGAELTAVELELAMETDPPALCSIHAIEDESWIADEHDELTE